MTVFTTWDGSSAHRLLERLRDIAQERHLAVLNMGAGVQSTAMALLAALGEIERPDVMIFADTHWEPQAVYDNLNWIAENIAGPADIPLVTVSGGNIRTDALRTDGGHYATMPLHILHPGGGRGMIKRQCTSEYKVKPIQRAVRAMLGAPISETGDVGRAPTWSRAVQLVGFSAEERERVLDDTPSYAEHEYPLMDLGLTRQGCQQLLDKHGRPKVAKSACRGCPFSGNARWRDMRDNRPDEWADVLDFDERIRHGHPSAGTPLDGTAFLHRSRRPLSEAPIDVVTAREWRQQQGELDLSGVLAGYDEDPPGCSPFGCRTTQIPAAASIEAAA